MEPFAGIKTPSAKSPARQLGGLVGHAAVISFICCRTVICTP